VGENALVIADDETLRRSVARLFELRLEIAGRGKPKHLLQEIADGEMIASSRGFQQERLSAGGTHIELHILP
jgi:hypothetical protein